MKKEIILSENAKKVASGRYFKDENENWEDLSNRVATAISSVETIDKDKHKENFAEIIYNMDFLPAGRILRNSGRIKGSLFNCYHLPIGDSREEIGQCLKDSLILWGEGGGVGINFSTLRPKGASISGVGGESSGLVSFLKATNSLAETIKSGGGRRAAALASVNISHPEIMDFIDAKIVDKELENFNISVIVNEEFLQAVEQDDDWEFKFKQKSYGKIKARVIWDKIINNMIKYGEPGLMNWNKFSKNNSYYFHSITGTNPCLAKGSIISTVDGLIPIEELVGKDFKVITDLRSVNQQGSFIESAKCFYTGEKKIYKITLSNNQSINLTDNHRIFYRENERILDKEVKDLKIGDTMLTQNTTSPHFVTKNINEKEFQDGLLVGWRLGDGWIMDIYKDIYPDRLSFNFIVNENEDIANKFIIKKLNQIKNDNELPVGWLKIKDGARELRTMSKSVQKWFAKYGYNKKSTSKIVTNEVLRESHSFKRGVLAGLFSADGHCDSYKGSKNGRIGLTSSKKEIIERIQIMLNEFGISSRYGKNIRKSNLNGKTYTSYRLTISSYRECFKFMNEIGFHLSRKKEETGWKLPRNKWRKDYFGEFKVKSINECGHEDVYDIQTQVTNSFISNGILVHNCGETTLGSYSVCCLGSLVLPNFISGKSNTNWKKLENVIKTAVRFLDNVIDVNNYTLRENDIKAHNSRRIGLGVMGLAEYLFAEEIRYGSEQSIHEIDRLMKFIRNCAYSASMELAKEKGAFAKFDSVQYSKASFVRKLPAKIRGDIKKYGVRNVTLLSMAPTGTISMIPEVSSGIEPLFAKAYTKTDAVGERHYIHPNLIEILKSGEEIPDWFVDAYDLNPEDHLEVQSIVQKNVCGAVSKTINMPSDATADQLSKLLLEYINDLKGVTVYVDGSKSGQPYNKIELEDIKKMLKENENIKTTLDVGDTKCNSGNCEI